MSASTKLAQLPSQLEGPSGRSERARRQVLDRFVAHLVGPLAAAFLTVALSPGGGAVYEGAALTFLAFAAGGLALDGSGERISALPLMGRFVRLAPTVTGLLALGILHWATGLPELPFWQLLPVGAVAVIPALLAQQLLRDEHVIRAALIGSAASAEALGRELRLAGIKRYRVVGNITAGEQASPESPLHGLGAYVEEHDIDLLLMTGEVSRLAIFDELAASCLHLPVRLWELSAFYEEIFGHVPIAEINGAWFQYIMHPKFRVGGGLSKRALDITIGVLMLVIGAPVLLVLGLLVRRDGGPALFRQQRVGEGGQPFNLYKLRTMAVGSSASVLTSADDPRVTGIGQLLRRSHLDELPQLINVIRGEMSIVGPRPEQPGFVERLERTIPYYSRRHLIKPGLSGWAQVRCGYAGSEVGSAWKVAHDLYYLKHRCMSLDLAILVETVRTVFADRQYGVEPSGVSYIMLASGLDVPKAVLDMGAPAPLVPGTPAAAVQLSD